MKRLAIKTIVLVMPSRRFLAIGGVKHGNSGFSSTGWPPASRQPVCPSHPLSFRRRSDRLRQRPSQNARRGSRIPALVLRCIYRESTSARPLCLPPRKHHRWSIGYLKKDLVPEWLSLAPLPIREASWGSWESGRQSWASTLRRYRWYCPSSARKTISAESPCYPLH